MNKKFSTLMAGLMLASAFSVSAQTVVEKYETNKTYWLGTGSNNSVTKIISVVSDPNDSDYGQLILVDPNTELTTIQDVKAATWTIVFTQPTDGTAPKFTYINKATGLTLSLDPDDAGGIAKIKGSSAEWLNTPITNADTDGVAGGQYLPFATLRSFYEANKAVFLYEDGGDLKVGVSENTSSLAYEGKNALSIAPAKPALFKLDADALNSQLGKVDLDVVKDPWFNLYFDQDVTEGAKTNLFAATQLKAVQIYYDNEKNNNASDANADFSTATTTSKTYTDANDQKQNNAKSAYVKLLAKDMDGAYITVDTAYHTGTETIGKLPTFTYAKGNYEGTNNVPRLEASSHFAFAYDPYEDKVLIKSRAYYTRVTGVTHPTPIEGTGVTDDGNEAFTWWGYNEASGSTPAFNQTDLTVQQAYVRLAKLASVRELTVGAQQNASNVDLSDVTKWDANNGEYGMSTTVKLSLGDLTYAPTSIADGL